ncbi:MAG: DUF4390 domain-containing protein [Rhodoferax sp.]
MGALLRVLCLVITLWGGGASWAQDEAATTKLLLHRSDEGVWLSAQLPLVLPAALESALNKGIPLHFVVRARVVQPRWYWSDKVIAQATRRVRLDYQPLTNVWRITWTGDETGEIAAGLGLTRQFETQAQALASLSRIYRWRIADASELDPATAYQVHLNLALDSVRLPRPLQIGTLGQADWKLDLNQSQTLEPLKP